MLFCRLFFEKMGKGMLEFELCGLVQEGWRANLEEREGGEREERGRKERQKKREKEI